MTARIVDVEALRGHTPGPWTHCPDDNIITADKAPRMVLIEWQARSKHVSIVERDANARLIAAAPDLLREVIERRARDAQVAELVEAAERAVKYGIGMKANDRLRTALSAIRGGATE